jgi:hypothetical protein
LGVFVSDNIGVVVGVAFNEDIPVFGGGAWNSVLALLFEFVQFDGV